MIYTSCTLRKIEAQYNDYGAKTTDKITETEVPIIKIEKVKVTEFYKAGEQGYKPNLRLVISALNYDDEQELEYGGVVYTIIRTEPSLDEVVIVAERKLKNV